MSQHKCVGFLLILSNQRFAKEVLHFLLSCDVICCLDVLVLSTFWAVYFALRKGELGGRILSPSSAAPDRTVHSASQYTECIAAILSDKKAAPTTGKGSNGIFKPLTVDSQVPCNG
jgi:hypothetical protein